MLSEHYQACTPCKVENPIKGLFLLYTCVCSFVCSSVPDSNVIICHLRGVCVFALANIVPFPRMRPLVKRFLELCLEAGSLTLAQRRVCAVILDESLDGIRNHLKSFRRQDQLKWDLENPPVQLSRKAFETLVRRIFPASSLAGE